jgi:hypothetical protein
LCRYFQIIPPKRSYCHMSLKEIAKYMTPLSYITKVRKIRSILTMSAISSILVPSQTLT